MALLDKKSKKGRGKALCDRLAEPLYREKTKTF